MAIPKYDEIMLPLLKVLSDGQYGVGVVRSGGQGGI
jgi:restriction endonuclease Mrr